MIENNKMSEDTTEDDFEDPATHHPYKRLFIRYTTLYALIIFILLIPAFVFYTLSIFFNLSTSFGMTFALLSFLLCLYLLWKKELWNLIKR